MDAVVSSYADAARVASSSPTLTVEEALARLQELKQSIGSSRDLEERHTACDFMRNGEGTFVDNKAKGLPPAR